MASLQETKGSAASCQTCSKAITSISSRLVCEKCGKFEHLVCLRQSSGPLPTPLLGDTFFTLLCCKCSPSGREVIKRDRVNWLTALTVAIYNLKKRSPHGKDGFFHWKQHIATFLESHWNIILGPQMKKRKTWLGTISGTLSHWSGEIFKSGSNVLKESGWWSLVDERLPADLIANASPKATSIISVQQKQSSLLICNNPNVEKLINPIEMATQPVNPIGSTAEQANPDVQRKRTRGVQSSILTAMALKEKRATLSEAKDIRKAQQQLTSTSLLIPSPTSTKISPLAAPTEPAQSLIQVRIDTPMTLDKTLPVTSLTPNQMKRRPLSFDDKVPQFKVIKIESKNLAARSNDAKNDINYIQPSLFNADDDDFKASNIDLDDFGTSIRSTTFSMDEMMSNSKDSLPNVEDLMSGLGNSRDDFGRSEENSNNTSCDEEELTEAPENRDEPKREIQLPKSKYKPLCRYEEEELLSTLENNSKLLSTDLNARIFFRKLKVRQQLRNRHLPVFDFDQVVRNLAGNKPGPESRLNQNESEQVIPQILDRFQIGQSSNNSGFVSKNLTLRDRLLGRDPNDLQCVTSPLTRRILKPFIRRDFKMRPTKLKLFEELRKRVCPAKQVEQLPIDFMYVRPHHIPLVNQLARDFFWPGIDLSECLQYPDFSCVVVYGKLVVAFAFMVPDVSHTEAYISFVFTHPEWRRAGIAKFMLYHLCQTCMGKDITLHVSANNPAVLLYQKFGFKVEEYVHNFYDKFLPPNSSECKHALFLRLSR